MREGYSIFLSWGELRITLILISCISFFVKPTMVIIPFYVIGDLDLPRQWIGCFYVSYAIGTIIGAFVSGFINTSKDKRFLLFIILLLLIGPGFVSLGITSNPYLIILNFIFNGIVTGYINNYLMSIISEKTNPETRGRVFSLVFLLSSSAGIISMLLSGILIDTIDRKVNYMFIVCGFFILLISIITLRFKRFVEFIKK